MILDDLRARLAGDVTFHSPVATYRGRDQVALLLTTAAGVLEDVRPGRELQGSDTQATFFAARVDGKDADGVIEARLDGEEIVELRLMLRPLESLLAAVRAMGKALGSAPPSLYDWAGGDEAFERLTGVFYTRVRADDVLGPVFRNMPDEHPHHVALWLAEVFGGPPRYTEEHGGYPHMLGKHRGLALTEEQRFRWVMLIAQAADDAGLPPDPEFRSAFLAYIEWGTRLALANSQPDADPPPRAPVPHWGWGEAPPYNP